MAIFHFSAKIVSRGKGQSAVAKAAYNSRAELTNEKTGERHDYTRAEGLAFEGIFAPKDAPEWAQDRGRLWSEVEKAETRKNSQLAREVQIALPHELTEEQRRQLVTDFVRENFVRKGLVADVAIHAPDREGDDRNHHAHVLLTMRDIGPEGFGEKLRELNSKEQLEAWRENWAKTANRYLERHGHEARIDHRSLADQGIDREPTTHNGPTATQMEREGEASERGDINREIEARNQEREKVHNEARAVAKQLTALDEVARKERFYIERERERRKLRPIHEETIREVATNAPSGLDFIIALQEKGFQLALDKRDRFTAIAENNSCFSLMKLTSPELLQEVRGTDGLIIPTVDQVFEDRRKAKEFAWLKQGVLYREARAAEWEARSKEFQANLDEYRRVELGAMQGEIRLAYALAPSGEAFASALEDRGLILARATAEDAAQSERVKALGLSVEGATASPLKEGAYYAVSDFGHAYQLNIRTTGATAGEIEKRLGPLEQKRLLDVRSAQLGKMSQVELGAMQGEIRLAYALAPSGEAFASALEDKGLILARATAGDVAQSERDRRLEFSHAPLLKEGAYYAVSGSGFAHQLNIRTTGATAGEIEKRLGPLDKASLWNVQAARSVMKDVRDQQILEREILRREREERAKTNAALSGGAGLGLVSQQGAANRRFQKSANQLRPMLPEEAARFAEKERQARDNERKAAAFETTTPRKESFADRKDHGAQKQAEHAARTEQTDRKQLKQSLEERLWNKRFEGTERGDISRERERER